MPLGLEAIARPRARGSILKRLTSTGAGCASIPGMADLQRVPANRFLPGIHGLRAVAALSVLIFHQAPALGALTIPWFAKPITMYGGLGVPLFFTLSAFSLAHSTYHRMGHDGWVREYGLRRFFRIAPLFYAMMIFFLLHDYIKWGKSYSVFEIIMNIVFLFGLVPGKHIALVWAGWTVGVEMLFYALFPVILSVVRGVKSAAGFLLFSCIAGICVVQELDGISRIDRSYLYENLCTALPSFAAGLAAYYGLRELRGTGFTQARIAASTGIAVAICIGISITLGFKLEGLWRVDVFTWAWAVAFSATTLWQTLAPSRVLSLRFFQYVGERSYSVYLVHAPIVFYLKPAYEEIYRLVPVGPLAYLSCVALGIGSVLLVASLTYALIEAPGVSIGAGLIRRGRTPVAGQPPLTDRHDEIPILLSPDSASAASASASSPS